MRVCQLKALLRPVFGFMLAAAACAGQASVVSLGAYNVKLDETSVSGISSGGYMAAQFGVAWSSIVKGVGIVAAGPYGCSQIPKPGSTYGNNLFTAFYYCANRITAPDLAPMLSLTATFAADGRIDPTANMAHQKVWIYSGYNDGVVKQRTAVDVLYNYYASYMPAASIYYKNNQRAGHAMVTNRSSHQACANTASPYLNNCGIDAAGDMLNHIYGRLNPRATTLTGQLLEFSQTAFASTANISMSSTGRVYVPASCAAGQPCRVHVALHGCKQSHEQIGTQYVTESGYNEWADTNNLIVLYPQTTSRTYDYSGVYQDRNNSEACWDWWGYNVDYDQNTSGNQNYANKKGAQIRAIRAMLTRLAGGYTGWQPTPAGGFGAPANVSAIDSTHNRVDLVWTPVSGASGYHVYRASCPSCTPTRITTTPVAGASYSSAGLSASTTYYYKVSAVNAAGTEGAASALVGKATAAAPPSCDPYFANNYTHVDIEGYTGEYRANAACLNCYTYSRGGASYLGFYNVYDSAPVKRTGNQYYVYGVCN
jgi:poly(3-hydroxybutyrate) depolymerase